MLACLFVQKREKTTDDDNDAEHEMGEEETRP